MPDPVSTALEIDCTTGQAVERPLTAEEIADRDAMAAEWAAQQAVTETLITNRETIKSRAHQALTANQTFLRLSSPTNAQVLAQVKVLTRENNALIRLLLDLVDDITDTA